MAQQMHVVQISSMQNQIPAGFVPAQVVRTTVVDVPTPEGPPGLAAGPPRADVNVGATVVHQNPVPVHIGSDTIANKHLAQSVSKIPVHVSKAITKASVGYEKDVMKLLKAESKLSLDMADIKVLEDLNHGRRYPLEYGHFRALRSKSSSTNVDEDNALIKYIPRGSSRREAMEIVHHTCCRFIKSTDAEGLREHVSHLKLKVTRDAFRQRCEKEAAQEKIDSLGLGDPSPVHVDQQQICSKIDKTYREIIEQIRKLKHKERKAAETKESVDKKQVEDAPFEKPGELLESAIADVVRKQLAGRHKSRDGDGDDDQIMAVEKDKPKEPNTQDVRRRVDAFVDKVGSSKNGLSPGGSLGGKSKYKMKGNRKQQENKKGKQTHK